MIRVLVNGAMGRMGGTVIRLIGEDSRFELAGRADASGRDGCPVSLPDVPADVIIDFSCPAAASKLAAYAVQHGTALVVGTTGYMTEDLEYIRKAAENVPVFYSSNMSLGIALLARLAQQAARAFPDADIEIVEAHHNRKVDAPSGTALTLADAVREVRPEARNVCGREGSQKREKDEIGIHALRMGSVVGVHEVMVATDYETITLRHEAHDRALFAKGALTAAEFITVKPAGLYSMGDLVGDKA